jgi:hypothetical protein
MAYELSPSFYSDPLINPNLFSTNEDFNFVCKDLEARESIENLWKEYREFADKGFAEKISFEFHNHFWEMYLTCTLKSLGKGILPKTKKEGPDIEIDDSGSHIWVEAVAASPGEGANKVPIPEISQQGFRVPEEQIVLRYTSVIDTKFQKYLGYTEKHIIAASDPYIIAVNGNKVPLSWDSKDEIPYIVQAVLPFGLPTINANWQNPSQSSFGYPYRPELSNRSGNTVQTDIFQRKEYEGISGILFSKIGVHNFRANPGEDFIFIHNPLALNKLPVSWLGIGCEYKVEGNILKRYLL